MSTTIEKLRKVTEAIQSNHVQSVEVGYEYEMDSIRYYTAISRRGLEQHKYTVRVQDWFNEMTNQTERYIKCTCHAGAMEMLCRHAVKVAEVDTDRTGAVLFLDDLAKYRAYKGYHSKAKPYICQLCGKASDAGTEHDECHQYEQMIADRYELKAAA